MTIWRRGWVQKMVDVMTNLFKARLSAGLPHGRSEAIFCPSLFMVSCSCLICFLYSCFFQGLHWSVRLGNKWPAVAFEPHTPQKIQNTSFLWPQWMTNILRASTNCNKLQWIANQIPYKILYECILNCIHGALCVFTYVSHMASSHWLRPLQSFEHLSMSTGAAIVSKTRDFLSVNNLQNLEQWNKNLRPWPHQPTIQLIVCGLRQAKETQNHLPPANRKRIATCFVYNLFTMCVFIFF